MSNCSGPWGLWDCCGPDSCPRNQHGNAEVKNKRKEKGSWAEKGERLWRFFFLSVDPLSFFHLSVTRFLLRKMNPLWTVTEFVVVCFV